MVPCALRQHSPPTGTSPYNNPRLPHGHRNWVFDGDKLVSSRVVLGVLPVCPFAALYGGLFEHFATTLSDTLFVVLDIPLSSFMSRLSYSELLRVAGRHDITIPKHSRAIACVRQILSTHTCTVNCDTIYHLFRILPAPPSAVAHTASRQTRPAPAHVMHSPLPHNSHIAPASVPSSFLPAPLGPHHEASFVRSWCDVFQPNLILEKPCAVCARLTVLKDLKSIAIDDIDLNCLSRPGHGLTRLERTTDRAPIQELTGPILYQPAIRHELGGQVMDICGTCYNIVKRRKIPLQALANGLWLGDVPPQLQQLTFLERMLVARVQHNYFVAKVNKGQRKLCANAIMFTQPLAKLYSVLPPPRAELDQCLAVLFVGSCKPTISDWKRTPFLVRHIVVLDALTWLCRNHCDYADVEISPQNLREYTENEPPICIIYRPGDGSAPVESLAVNELDEEKGTEHGPCSFAIHGLTGAHFATMTHKQKIATAVRWFESGGKVLAYGHQDLPESIYHNPHLFPSMFPWLFPYGLGAFENTGISTHLHRIQHVRHLLLYADRRFQVDECFPFIAFNHEQIHASSHGGWLLTSRRNFPSIVDKILNLDMDALNRVIARGSKGEYVQPDDDAEKRCFELMTIVDHVAAHVQGSATHKKYQRREIKVLIMKMGAPMFFITFAPVDIKHPLCLYYCGELIDMLTPTPAMPDIGDSLRAIAKNPVACARFFHFIVETFLSRILKVGVDEEGLFGKTDAYYGTVESQGRLTLHLHLLLWIACSLSPQETRDRILADDGFHVSLLVWLQSCHTGDFSTGS